MKDKGNLYQKKILVVGGGYIGRKIGEKLGCAVAEKRILSFRDADELLAKENPDILINAIGFTGRNVDECEGDKDKTMFTNTFLPILLAEATLRRNIKFVHIGSGCIFHFDYEKDAPIDEKRIPDFFDLFYSRSKFYADAALERLMQRYPILIVRIRIPLDTMPNPKNILTKLISYKKIIDLPNSITYIPDFISALVHLLECGATGIFNVVNKGGLRYKDLLDIYKRYMPEFSYEIIPYEKLNRVRTNLIMSTEKLESTGFKVRDIHQVLEECVQEYIKG